MTAPSVTVHVVGTEREPIAVIDHFAADPDALRAAAAAACFEPAGQHYPGIKAPLPDSYLRDQRALIGTMLRAVFGVTGAVRVLDARFSIVTTPPAELDLHQCLPHVDAIAPDRLALIHYLVPGGTGGTAFYRHRATGFETVTEARAPGYFAALEADVGRHPVAPGYLAGDTSVFDRVAGFDGTFNRALLYRGRLLHCGDIGANPSLSHDPAAGRLTVTGFFAAD